MQYNKQDTIVHILLPVVFKYLHNCWPFVWQCKDVAFDLLSMLHRALSRSRHAGHLRRRCKDTPFDSHTSKLSPASYSFSASRALQMLIFWVSTSAFHPRDSFCKPNAPYALRACGEMPGTEVGQMTHLGPAKWVRWPTVVGCQSYWCYKPPQLP